MFPEWHHAVPESAYFKVPETLKHFVCTRLPGSSMFCIGWQPDYVLVKTLAKLKGAGKCGRLANVLSTNYFRRTDEDLLL